MQAERSLISRVILCHERVVRLLRRISLDLENDPTNVSDEGIITSCSRFTLRQCTFDLASHVFLPDAISGGFVFYYWLFHAGPS